MDVKTYLRLAGILLAIVLVWALSFVLSIAGLNHMPPATLTTLRFVIASIFLGMMYGRKAMETFKKAPLKDQILLASTGISGVTLAHFLQVARRYSYAPSATDATFLLNLVPVFIIIFALLFRLEKPSLAKLTVAGVGTLGMITILANWEKPSSFSPFSLFRYEEGLLLASALFLALFVVGAKKLVEGYSAPTLATLAVWAGTIPLAILALVTDGPLKALTVPIDGWIIVIILGILSSALFFLLIFDALALTTASRVSSAFFLTPMLMTLLIVLEKPLGAKTMPSPLFVLPIVVGSLLVLLGVVSLWIEQSKSS